MNWSLATPNERPLIERPNCKKLHALDGFLICARFALFALVLRFLRSNLHDRFVRKKRQLLIIRSNYIELDPDDQAHAIGAQHLSILVNLRSTHELNIMVWHDFVPNCSKSTDLLTRLTSDP